MGVIKILLNSYIIKKKPYLCPNAKYLDCDFKEILIKFR